MLMMPDERAYVRARIASILDYPSVYMGGPSANSLRRADDIINELERQCRIVTTTCDHERYEGYKVHGIACPDCGWHIGNESK